MQDAEYRQLYFNLKKEQQQKYCRRRYPLQRVMIYSIIKILYYILIIKELQIFVYSIALENEIISQNLFYYNLTYLFYKPSILIQERRQANIIIMSVMRDSPCYLRIAVPGDMLYYQLSIFAEKVEIKYCSPLPLHNGFCQLNYKVEDRTIKWLEVKKDSIFYSKNDSLAVINFLKQFPRRNLNLGRSRNIPTLSDVIKKLEEIQNLEVKQQKAQEIKVVQVEDPLAQRRRIFGASQVKQIQKGNVECIFCSEILVPGKFHQLKCGHCFHYPCIRKYCGSIKNECPVCKYTPKYGPSRLRCCN